MPVPIDVDINTNTLFKTVYFSFCFYYQIIYLNSYDSEHIQ